MQLDSLIVHLFFLVGSLWIAKQGINGIVHRKLQINLRGLKREFVGLPSLVLSLIYAAVGIATFIMIVASFFQTDYRLLQLVGVFWIALIMINIFAYWLTHDP
jgi:hypothetical protein